MNAVNMAFRAGFARTVLISSPAVQQIRQAVEAHWRQIFNFAYRMTLDYDRARAILEEVYVQVVLRTGEGAAGALGPRLMRMAGKLAEREAKDLPEITFDMLDETLRSDVTRRDRIATLTEPERDSLLWELKQGCMTAVVNCLPPSERVAFVLSVVLGFGDEEAAGVLSISGSAFKVRLSRARVKVTDYLASRCEQVDPRNPCSCPSRLEVALDKGFVSADAADRHRPSFGRYGSSGNREDAPLRDVVAIYQSLPDPDMPADLPEALIAKLEETRTALIAGGRRECH
ncbi:MAG: sigma factor-like helix-turn-helix DNA-binding protein [Pseudomonadota bacterium]